VRPLVHDDAIELVGIERGEEQASDFRSEIDGFTREVVAWFADKERGDLRIARTPLAPCPTPGCEGQIVEYPKSYGCNSYKGKDDFLIRGQTFLGDKALYCSARLYPMRKGQKAKADIPLVAKMCQSLKAK